MVSGGVSHIFQIVVFTACAHALLGGNGAHIRSLLETQKCLLELIHARIGKKQCRIIGRHQGARFNPGMTLGLKITEESFANVGRFHG